MCGRERIIAALVAAAEAGDLVEGAERAALDQGRRLRRPVTFLGDDRDHAADCIGAIEAALRAAQHLDAGDVGGQQLAEIERAVGVAGIADVDAVDEHLDLVRVGAAHEDRGLAAGPAGLHDVEAGHVGEGIRHRAALLALDIRGGDDRDRACDITGWSRHRGRAVHDLCIGLGRGLGGRQLRARGRVRRSPLRRRGARPHDRARHDNFRQTEVWGRALLRQSGRGTERPQRSEYGRCEENTAETCGTMCRHGDGAT